MVWIPKYRKKVLYGNLIKYLGEIFLDFAGQGECKINEGHPVKECEWEIVSP